LIFGFLRKDFSGEKTKISPNFLNFFQAIADHPSAVSSIVSLLNLDCGEAPLFSSSRIIGNYTQYLVPTRPQALSVLHDTPGCLSRLASLLLPPSHGGYNVKDPEIKYNAVASLSSLLLSDADVAALASTGAALGIVFMLTTPDQLTQQHVVTALKKMVRHPGVREELRRSKEAMTTLFESSKEVGTRYSVIEIVSALAEQDLEFLNSVPECT
jgi:hypothetical protein